MEMMMKNSTPTPEATTSPALQYIALKTATATKLGKHANGGIGYKVSCDPCRAALYFSITDNTSGGYFSPEYICVNHLQELLSKLDQPTFPSKTLKIAFAGKSSNNAGFLAAILHAEGLLAPAPENEAKHVLVGDWNVWKAALLVLERSAGDDSTGALLPADTPMPPDKHNTLTLKRTKATDCAD